MNGRKILAAGGVVVAGVCAFGLIADDQDNGRVGGSDGGDIGLNLAGGPTGWTLKNPNIVWTPDLVGINVSSPTAQLDVKGAARFRNNTTFNKNLTVEGKLIVQRDLPEDSIYLLNRSTYAHPSFADPQILGDGGDAFILASNEGSGESAGVYGDGDVVTLWSAGDGTGGIGQANVIVLDEDRWSDDTNPYSGLNSLIAYLNDAGTWVASDINRKQNILPLTGATEALMRLNGYTYDYKLAPTEVAKGQQPLHVAGLIAQEVIEVLPEAVNVTENGEHFINYDVVIPLLVEALKDQVVANDEQQARIEDLEARLAALERALSRNP
jgi:hypothetical protein